MKKPESSSSILAIGPYSDQTARLTTLEIYRRDSVVRRSIGSRKFPKRSGTATIRGRVGGFSAKSRQRLLWLLRNGPVYDHFLTLTYSGKGPRTVSESKRDLDRVVRWLRKKVGALLWKMEFGTSGIPHFHILLNGEVSQDQVCHKWSELINGPPSTHLVCLEKIRDFERVASYLCKPLLHPAHQVSPEFGSPGRWWGTSGEGAKAKPLFSAVGPEGTIAPLVRPVRKRLARKSGMQGRPRKDKGICDLRLYGGGGKEGIENAVRIAEQRGFLITELPLLVPPRKKSAKRHGGPEGTERIDHPKQGSQSSTSSKE